MHLAGQERGEAGYAMAALLVSLGVMAILMTMALPVWRHQAQREKEAELIFRGEQYARAVALFQRKVAGAYPPNLDVLVDQKYLRKKYKDPMAKDGEFEILYQATASPQAQQGAGAGQTRPPTSGGLQSQRPPTTSVPPTTQSSGAAGTGGGRGGVVGVVSKSKEQSIRLYKGRSRYNEWQFIYTPVTVRPTGPVTPQNQPGGGRTLQGGTGPTGPRPSGPLGPFGPTGQPRPPQGGIDPTRPFPMGPQGPTGRPSQPPR